MPPGLSREQIVAGLAEKLRLAAHENPRRLAQRLIAEVLGITPAGLIADCRIKVSLEHHQTIEKLGERLVQGEPLSRVLGFREFWGRRFALNDATLDPRPDSETLIEAVQAACGHDHPERILDLGTGSGCLLITLLDLFPRAWGLGTDLSASALTMAQRNAAGLHNPARAHFAASHWLDGLRGEWDLIVSNPPYIGRAWRGKLEQNVLEFDPELALFGGEDGLDAYRELASGISDLLAPGGHLFLEIGYDQREEVRALFRPSGLSFLGCTPDLAGHDRVMGFGKK